MNDEPPEPPPDREPVSNPTRRNLARFYGGLRCVVSEGNVKGCPHHLNGRPQDSEFPNLLPVNLELHNVLRRKKEIPEDVMIQLRTEKLVDRANEHFRSGRVPQAYGCLRLAYAMCAHYHTEQRRDMEKELSLAAHCLYFLRRSTASAPQELVFSTLDWLLEQEIYPTLDENTIRPPFGDFCLLVELASWLNEFGWSEQGLELLRKARERLDQLQKSLKPNDISRFERQLANALIQGANYGVELETALAVSAERDNNNENNRFALFTTRLNQHLSKEDIKKSITVLEERFDYFEKHTDYCFGPLEGIDTTIQTSLGYIALSILCESQVAHTKKQRQEMETRLEALKTQERRYSVISRLNRIPNLEASMKRAACNVPEMEHFLEGRVFPLLPEKSGKSVLRITARL